MWGLFLHVFVHRGPEGQFLLKPSSFGGEGLLEAGEWCLFSYGEGHIGLGLIYRYATF